MGVESTPADALSRNKLGTFFVSSPKAHQYLLVGPKELLVGLWSTYLVLVEEDI
jgi:hypothetical protein